MYKIPRALICRCKGVTPVSAHLSIADTDAPKCNCRREMPHVLPEARGSQGCQMLQECRGRAGRLPLSLWSCLVCICTLQKPPFSLWPLSRHALSSLQIKIATVPLSQSLTSTLPANHHYDRVVEFIPRGIPGRCTITSQRVHLGPRFKSQPQLLTCHRCLPPRSNPLQGVLLDPLLKGLQNLSHPMSSAGITPSNPFPVLCSTPMILPRGQPEGCPENIHPAPGGLSSAPIVLSV